MDMIALAQQLLNGVAAQTPAANNSLVSMIIRMVQYYPGGIAALINQFEQSGLADEVQSWVSTGPNQPINAAQIQQALANHVAQIAQQTNVPQQAVANGLANILPQLIDKLTPQGSVPQSQDGVHSALEELKSKLAA